MAFAAIFDVVKKISEELLPANKHQILSLAKTDQEKQAKLDAEGVSDPGDVYHLSWSKSERAAWLRHCYKKPIAAAGVRRPINVDGPSIEVSKASRAEIECEKARERRLKRHATQGVVALFNAVKQHQSVLEKHLDATGPLVFQKEKVVTGFTTSDFLDRLSAGLPGAKTKLAKEVVSDVSCAPKKSKLNSLSVNQVVMNFSSKDSIFECTGSSAADFTLSCFDEGDSAPKPSANSAHEEENKMLNERENARLIELADISMLNDGPDQPLTVLKACVRHDIMEQISYIMSDLVAIDLKYSELAQISASQDTERMKKPIQDPIPVKDDQKRTSLESLHAYTISELRSQLSALRVFIQDLDAKYFEVARYVQERIEKLEQCKNSFIKLLVVATNTHSPFKSCCGRLHTDG
ncbi:unnamed protein product [Taenia asiatica]|uniref:RRP15-like protein n=1 Tax=Taenia asiatica TaxID=60517 RepID=A0A0R3W548_TAEAS|nr:unnamed protein product [Taenia asiatica]